jgi:hypothetical protein
MRTKKKPEAERSTVEVHISFKPYFAAVSEQIPGAYGIGETKGAALTSLRSEIRRRYPFHTYDVEEILD